MQGMLPIGNPSTPEDLHPVPSLGGLQAASLCILYFWGGACQSPPSQEGRVMRWLRYVTMLSFGLLLHDVLGFLEHGLQILGWSVVRLNWFTKFSPSLLSKA